MNRLTLLFLAFSLTFVPTNAQSRAVPPAAQENRTQSLANQDVIEMVKLGLSADVVIAKIKASPTEFKTDTAALVELKQAGVPDAVIMAMVGVLAAPAATPQPAEKDVPTREAAAVERIISAMRRLDNAIAVGVTFQNYSALLIENKTIIDETLKDAPEGPFKYEIGQALIDHQYAMAVWSLAVTNGWVLFYTKQEPGRTLVTRYGYPERISIWTQVPVMNGLNYVWMSARNHFNLAVARSKVQPPLPPASLPGSNSLIGSWQLNLELNGNPVAATLAIEGSADDLSGRFESGGQSVALKYIPLDGGKWQSSFTSTERWRGNLVGLWVNVDGDNLDGTSDMTAMDGQLTKLHVTGKRVK